MPRWTTGTPRASARWPAQSGTRLARSDLEHGDAHVDPAGERSALGDEQLDQPGPLGQRLAHRPACRGPRRSTAAGPWPPGRRATARSTPDEQEQRRGVDIRARPPRRTEPAARYRPAALRVVAGPAGPGTAGCRHGVEPGPRGARPRGAAPRARASAATTWPAARREPRDQSAMAASLTAAASGSMSAPHSMSRATVCGAAPSATSRSAAASRIAPPPQLGSTTVGATARSARGGRSAGQRPTRATSAARPRRRVVRALSALRRRTARPPTRRRGRRGGQAGVPAPFLRQ